MAKRKPTKKAKAKTSARGNPRANPRGNPRASERARQRIQKKRAEDGPASGAGPDAKKRKPIAKANKASAKLAKPAKPVKSPQAKPSKPSKPSAPRPSKSGGPSTPRKAQLAKPKRPTIKRARVLSKNPEAIRSRKRREVAKREELKKAKKPARRRAESEAQRRRRRERRGVEDAERAAREKLTGRPKVAPKKKPKKKGKRGGLGRPEAIDEMRELATGWLEQLRDIAATITPTSLDVTDPSGRDLIAPEQEGASRRRRGAGRRPWLVVGRFDFLTPIGYDIVGEVLSAWNDDYILAAAIHPDRLSQIRIIYEDPNETRGDGDDFIAQIGAWSFVVQELVFEILGTGVADEADQDALVLRYARSIVPRLYVYFSPDLMGGTTIDIGKKVVEKFKL